MRVNRPVALLIAALTAAPWLFFAYFVGYLMSQMPRFPSSDMPPEQFMMDFQRIFAFQMLSMALMVILLIFYIVHLFNTTRVPADKKALWAVVLLLGNLLAMPFYWFFYIWPREGEGAA